jgi:hypothetical protein
MSQYRNIKMTASESKRVEETADVVCRMLDIS